jgi:deferrochelatase/peroxidase EfeB
MSGGDRPMLQSGIYLNPADGPPKAFLFVVLDLANDIDRAAARHAIQTVWNTLAELKDGKVRDLTATRPGNRDVMVDTNTFDALLGYGASFFHPERALTPQAKPALLVPLDHDGGPFSALKWGDGVEPRSGEGDLAIQLTGRDAHAVKRAAVEIWKVIVDEHLPLVIRQTFSGFARDDKRSWIGFHDGISNIKPSQRLAAIECAGDPDWNRGGTYLAFLQCQVDLRRWRELSREDQELLVGRDKLTGCALEKTELENDTVVPRAFAGCPAGPTATPLERDLFRDPPETGDPIIEASHIHRANQNRAEPTTPSAHRIFRQGYEYLEEIGPDGPRLGLNFVSLQRDLEHLRQILGLSSWLGEVNFGGSAAPAAGPPPVKLIDLLAGGFYAVPPAARPFPGAALFDAVQPHDDGT